MDHTKRKLSEDMSHLIRAASLLSNDPQIPQELGQHVEEEALESIESAIATTALSPAELVLVAMQTQATVCAGFAIRRRH